MDPSRGDDGPAPSTADEQAQVAEKKQEEQITDRAAGPLAPTPAIPVEPEELIYVSLFENKETVGGPRPARSRGTSGGHYMIKFFLVDVHGNLHLAATGQDLGDSHYEYTNETGFPALFCHNKNEVKSWADQIMLRSQARAGYTQDVVTDVVPADGSSVKLPAFVSYSSKREELLDGRHRLLWYLLDTEGHNHLAVTGEEKETRDGHYNYHTETIFDYAAPLESGNQDEVKKWLEKMVAVPHEALLPAAVKPRGGKVPHAARHRHPPPHHQHHVPHSAYSAYSTPYSPGSRGRRGRGRGRGPGRPPRSAYAHHTSGGRFGTSSLLRQATSNMVRRGRGAWRVMDPDRDARELVAAELKRWAHEEAMRREAAKTAALAYAGEGLSADEIEVLERCMPILSSASSDGTSAGEAAAATEKLRLVATLGALREISNQRPSLALSAHPGLRETLTELSASSQPDVATLASWTLQQWLRSMVAHVQVLAEPRFVQDPRPALDKV